MEVSYCTFEFGAIIQRDLRALSFPCYLLRYHHYAGVYDILHAGKVTMACLAGSAMKKIWKYNNSAPYVTPRWPLQGIPPLNFLDLYRLHNFKLAVTSDYLVASCVNISFALFILQDYVNV